MWKFAIFFFVVQLINVILSTAKTIITAKGNKLSATLINTVCYGFYTIVIVYTASDFSLWVKVLVTVVTNLIGVYFSMWLIEKLRKDKLWEIVATVDNKFTNRTKNRLLDKNISFNFDILTNQTESVFHIYSKNQKESETIKTILDCSNAKYIVHEESVKL